MTIKTARGVASRIDLDRLRTQASKLGVFPRADTSQLTELALALKRVTAQYEEKAAQFDKKQGELEDVQARLAGLETEVSGRRIGGRPIAGHDPNSIGAQAVKSDLFAQFVRNGAQGKVKIEINASALTSSPGTAGSLIAPDRQTDIVQLPRRPLRLRQLLAPGTTNSDLVQFPRMTGRSDSAEAVSEGAAKPQASLSWELAEARVSTIATWIPASRQILQDVPMLQSMIDNELRYMVALEEENQILFGDGSFANLDGIVPWATAFAAPYDVAGGETDLDVILQAKAQVETTSQLPCDGIVMNPLRWARILSMKDGEGRYMSPGGAFSSGPGAVWGLPVIESLSIDDDHFLIGAFRPAAQIIDRQATTLYISDSHADFFIKNMIVLLMEERVALALKRPDGVVFASFPTGTGT